jgi:hypothetical protein
MDFVSIHVRNGQFFLKKIHMNEIQNRKTKNKLFVSTLE